MKNILSAIVMVLLPLISFAQFGLGTPPESDKLVTWKFSLKPVAENVYTFTATAQIEKGYHIFHLDAGGDGTLINTAITIDGSYETDDEWEVIPAPKTVQIDIIEGDIYWHEKSVSFSQEMVLDADVENLSGEVYFQVCNEEKCLPPATKAFEIQLKK